MPTQPLSARYLHGNSNEDYSFCFAVSWYNRNVHDVHLRCPKLAGALLPSQSFAYMAVQIRLAWFLPSSWTSEIRLCDRTADAQVQDKLTINHPMQYAGIDKLTSPASLDVYRAALLDSIDIRNLCVHWAHKPCKKGWCDPCIQLSSPFGIWENPPEPAGNLWEALDDSISLLACRFALQGTRSRVLHQSSILRL